MRDSVVYLAKNIKLDKNYKNVLKYSEQQMIELITNQNNLVYYGNKFSFLREDGSIKVEVPYSQALQSNYIAFQNPDYSNKWFFAFIDKVEYISNATTKIYYTIDLFSTWWSYWSPKACYVIREHVEDDSIGLHTVPENVETGDYIIAGVEDLAYDGNSYYICAGISDDILTNDTPDKFYNGVVSGLTYVVLKTNVDVNRLISRYNKASKIDAIYSLFMIPSSFLGVSPQWRKDSTGLINFAYISSNNSYYSLGEVVLGRRNILGEGNVGYTPKNNKLLTFPYIYILADNNAGSTSIYKYEYFKNPLNCVFASLGSISAGCGIKTVPRNYKGVESESDFIASCNFGESINNAKLPIGSWTNDVYTNWLTQNGINIATSVLTGSLQVAGGVLMSSSGVGAVAGAGNIASGGLSIASTIGQVYQHALAPDQAEGNVNSSDVMFSVGKIAPTFYQMSIKIEFAKVIDGYFSRCGYQVNSVKVPNMLHRQNYNYVMIGNEETLCYCNNHNGIMIPASDLNQINNMFRLGVTLWNDHNNLGDYSVSNNIN